MLKAFLEEKDHIVYMQVYILFIVGFVFLIKGADLLVEGATSIGRRLNISSIVIGLTIVSFGTSLPELLVNLIASYNDNPDIGVGNVLGSNIANILLILGVAAIINPLPITKNTYFIEVPFSLTATLLVGFLANASFFGKTNDFIISQYDGFILLFFFVLFMGYVYIVSKQKRTEFNSDEFKQMPITKSVIFIVIGIVGLYFGGIWVVDGAVTIARAFHMSEGFIGLTIIALGTSLPELVTSAMAAFKKNTDIAVGNVVGSNIFNLLWILGVSASIKPIPYDVISNADIFMIIASSTLLILAVVIGKKPVISRWEGFFFLIAYAWYITFLLQRG
ncbi:calcium/sodium antiporter [Fulvivirga maritima]|uniref:calcium/sodium antiporter n=1 Tax=Fulvivirga maritima TaxID=2904247 RepID=UPI001F281F33|nr:calcium/sodium antiporter [Fulvivirga maritima]UII28138.1 calcium/sodium antiporter [Fulvivirga maritima]